MPTAEKTFKITIADLLVTRNASQYEIIPLSTVRGSQERAERLAGVDRDLINARFTEFEKREGPRIGDFIVMLDGVTRRFMEPWPEALQTTDPGTNGSFYLSKSSVSCTSAGGGPTLSMAKIEATKETRMGWTWMFTQDRAGANRGVHFSIPYRVFREI